MKYFLVKGHHSIKNLKELGNKTYAVTETGLFKIRENLHSNSFVLFNNSNFNQISQICEFDSVDLKEIYKMIPFSSIFDGGFIKNGFSVKEIFDKKICDDFCKKFFVFEYDFKIYKFKYEEIVKILKYLQSIETINENLNLFNNMDLNLKSSIVNWIDQVFRNNQISLLMGFFILLDSLENEKIDSFLSEWKRADLNEIDVKSLLRFIEDSFIEKNQITKIKQYLSRIV